MYNMPIVKPAPTPLQQLIGGFKGGLNIANALRQAETARRQQAFQEKLQPLQLQKMQTEIKYMPEKYKQAAEKLALQERINSPEQLASALAYRQALTRSAPARALSTFGKTVQEQSNLKHGMTVTGATPDPNIMSSEERQLLLNQYDLSRIKQTTDTQLRQSLIQANSIDNTLKSIPFKKIAKFYGPKGRLLAAQEAAKVSAGYAPSPDYQSYLNFNNVTGPGAVGQIRKFLTDSVTQGARTKLEGLVFPSKWSSNPITAYSQWQALLDLYNIEKRARHTAVVDPHIFLGTIAERPSSRASGIGTASTVSAPTGQIKMRGPDGKLGTIPASDLKEALATGYTRV